jgi:predicted phage tail protein
MSEDKDRLVDINDLKETSKFLYKQKLFFNGAITDRSNLRQFITDVAPYFLCNFVITDGKFSLKPAIPHNPESGDINRGPVAISQLFTGGNILEDTFKVEYLSSEERRPFKAVVRYRQESRNQFPQEKVVEVKLGDDLEENNLENLPNEAFDLTQFCTSKAHAVKVAKYFLGLRRLVTHTISFSTTLDGLNIQAGSYIKVVTETSPYSSANNGTIDSQGNITSVKAIEDGQYKISYFKENSEEVQDGKVTVSDNKISNSKFHSSIFSIVDTSVSADIYIVEQLTFSQEGTVDIVASQHPCDDGDRSELARLMLFGNFNVQSS